MIRLLETLPLVLLVFVLTHCGAPQEGSELATPPLTKVQALADLETLVAKVDSLYGPLEFKQERFGYQFAELAAAARQEIETATTEREQLAAIARLLMRFRDGHVSIQFPLNSTGVNSYRIGAFLIPVEGRAIVAKVDPELAEQGMEVGDELLTVDGQKPFDLLPTILKYDAFGNEVSDQHAIHRVLNRRFYMTELVPKSPMAHLVFAKKDGSQRDLNMAWELRTEPTRKLELAPRFDNFVVPEYAEMAAENEGGLLEMGAYKPFFATDAVKTKFHLVEVEANDDFLKKYEVTREKLQDKKGKAIYAALLKYEGKTILIIRQPGYWPAELKAEDLVKGYRAVLDQFDEVADALIIDQNHNPGGSLLYAHDFFSLFVNKPAVNLVQKMNADREWIVGLHEWADELEAKEPGYAKAMRARAQLVDRAMDEGQSITAPMPLIGFEYVQPDKKYTWKKPVLVLADELAGSCGDIFPMYMQRNGIAKIFGERTMGLGGNVEEVIKLPYSAASVRLTRGLFTTYKADGEYRTADLVENNGITPDYKFQHTVSDVREGFVGYVEAVLKEAVKL